MLMDGWLPLHFACKAEVLDTSIIDILKESHDAALTAVTEKVGATPLILAILHTITSYEVVHSLTTDEVAKQADKEGLLVSSRNCFHQITTGSHLSSL
jgi:hypothetical protein